MAGGSYDRIKFPYRPPLIFPCGTITTESDRFYYPFLTALLNIPHLGIIYRNIFYSSLARGVLYVCFQNRMTDKVGRSRWKGV